MKYKKIEYYKSKIKNKFSAIIILISLIILIQLLIKQNNIDFISRNNSKLKKYNNTNPVDMITTFNKTRNIKKVLYITRHSGTKSNFFYIAQKLGFNTTFLYIKYPYGERPNCYLKDKCKYFVKSKCSVFDFIIISDTIPDSFIYLTNECKSKIILEITNRFDIGVPKQSKEEYYKTISKALKKNVTVVENNPYEIYYACTKKVFIQKYYLIRPVGYPPITNLNNEHTEFQDIIVVVNKRAQDREITIANLKQLNIQYKVLPRSYGGPLNLARYKAVIILPYQVSIMKIYENFRYGVAMIIPTERLLRQLIKENNKYDISSKKIFEKIFDIPNGPRKYIEFYNDEFKDFFVYFDSYKDLPNIIKNTDFSSLKLKLKEYMKNYEKKAIKLWSEVLNVLPIKESQISDKKPLCNKKEFY